MYRVELPRVYELRDMAQISSSPDAYFQDFCKRLAESRVMLKHFRDIETDLQGLGAPAWEHLKVEVAPLLASKDDTRGWQSLFDKLNEAKGYNHLVNIGCTDVRFIPQSSVKGEKTPDLEGILAGVRVLCEVKTINVSDVEASRRASGAAGGVSGRLPEGFLNKLKSDLTVAQKQMAAYSSDSSAIRIAFVVVNFDDILHEYADEYSRQIFSFIETDAVPGIEIVLYTKPPFYSATA